MKLWLSRNWIGLVLVSVLLPATVGITFATQWTAYFEGSPSAPIAAGAGDTVDYGTAQWALTDTRRISSTSAEGEDAGLPAGSDLVIVTVRVSPDLSRDETPGCLSTLDEFDGSTVVRSWGEPSAGQIDFTPTEGTTSYCASDAVGDYTLESIFVVPSDAGDNLALSLVVASELPRYLSFRL